LNLSTSKTNHSDSRRGQSRSRDLDSVSVDSKLATATGQSADSVDGHLEFGSRVEEECLFHGLIVVPGKLQVDLDALKIKKFASLSSKCVTILLIGGK